MSDASASECVGPVDQSEERDDQPLSIPGSTIARQVLWLAMFADLYLRAALVSSRFLQRGWLKARV